MAVIDPTTSPPSMAPATAPADWINGTAGGEMGRRVRAFDWSATPLGPIVSWSAALRTTVGICLHSRFPMFIWWGEQLVNLYNDAYIPVLGKRHPRALGESAPKLWHEIWPQLAAQTAAVMTRGEATFTHRGRLTIERNDHPEDAFFTWSHSPIPDETGRVLGLLCAVTEETDAVLVERQQDHMARQRQLALDAARMGWWHYDPQTNRGEWDNRFCEIFGVHGTVHPNDDSIDRIHPEDRPAVLQAVAAALDPAARSPFDAEYRIIRPDGVTRHVEAHGLATFENDHAIALVGTVADITDRVAERNALRVSEQRLALAVDAGQLGTFYCPLPFGELVWNDTCRTHFWLPPGSPVDIDLFFARLHPDDREPTRVAIETSIGQDMPMDTEYRTVAPDGRFRWIRARGRAYYDEEGTPTRFDGVTLDITTQKQAETALRDSEKRFREMADTAPAMLWITEPDGYCTFLSRGWYEYTGQTEAEGHGYGWSTAAHPDDQLLARDAFIAASAARVAYSIDFRLRRADGSYSWVIDAGHPRFGDDGTFLGFIGSVIDIDDRKRAANALRDSERRSRFLAELGEQTRDLIDPEAIMAVVARGLGTFLNVSRCAYADVEADGNQFAIRHDYTDGCVSTVGNYSLDLFGPRAAAAQRAGETLVINDIDAEITPDGGAAMFNAIGIKAIICCPLVKAGRLVAMMAVHQSTPRRWSAEEIELVEAVVERSWAYIERARVARDRERLLAGEQAARLEAERAGKMKDEFLATLSHELRTPLNAILGWAQIMRSGPQSADDIAHGLDVIDRNARAQTQIIEDLLDMSRIISGKVRLEIGPVDLADVVHQAIATVRPAADAKGVRLTATIDPLSHAFHGDAGRLQQVFWNLLSNAVKFTPKGGRVQVRLERVASHLEISFLDNGEGIKPEFLPFVFDRFRQADATTTRRHGGLGLGLSIVKQLIELHGGAVRVVSEGLGQGSTFTVELPLAPFRAAPSPAGSGMRTAVPVSTLVAGVKLEGTSALVVDDEPDARNLVRRLLEDRGAVVVAAGNVAEALAAARETQFDVIVSDIGMPGDDGYNFIRRLRAFPAPAGQTPAIALTAYARAEDRVAVLTAGFQTHLAKPVDATELLAVVASLVRPATA